MKYSTEADREIVSRLNGLYVGQLTEDERDSLNRCIRDGFAKRIYEGAAGLLGVAKIVVLRPSPTSSRPHQATKGE